MFNNLGNPVGVVNFWSDGTIMGIESKIAHGKWKIEDSMVMINKNYFSDDEENWFPGSTYAQAGYQKSMLKISIDFEKEVLES